ncbi:MAG TPA: SDR family oxidoreductase [Micromonospora sp.]|nr:SDR family oxidoreductase [Micromonospora sp.]
MNLEIKNRVSLVLGAGGGLGGAIALALAREGATVIGCDISASGLDETVRNAAEEGTTVTPMVADLADLNSLDALVASITDRFGPVSILVNNTGGPPPSTAAGVEAATWRQHFDSMVLPVFHLTDLVLPGMRELGWGRVITSTSSGVVAPIPNLGVSNALRSALVGWSKTLAAEVGPDGITANIVLPGRIATSRIVALDEAKAAREGRSVDEVRAESVASIPLRRYGKPSDYGDVVAFLASERASFINGSIIRVDGGMIPSI